LQNTAFEPFQSDDLADLFGVRVFVAHAARQPAQLAGFSPGEFALGRAFLLVQSDSGLAALEHLFSATFSA